MKKFFSGLKTKMSSLYSKNRKLFIVVVSLVLVIIVCFLFYPKSEETAKNQTAETKSSEQTSLDYTSKIEAKVKEMLLSLEEVTKANVMVLCESTEIVEYQKNVNETTSENSSSKNEEVAYEKDGSKSTPIVVTTKNPKIVGVWIIINSVSASTKLAITNSICSVLNIDETSINILQER